MAQTAATPFEKLALRAGFGLSQGARLAWYLGQGYAMRQLRALAPTSREQPGSSGPGPGRERMLSDVRDLLLRDLANVEAGIYPMPRGEDGSLLGNLSRTLSFFADLPNVHYRREGNHHDEVLTGEFRGKRPRYYLQNFHFQSGGWMSEESARIYDIQVEVLFNGTANAMRRQVLVPLAGMIRGRDQRAMRLVDVGCGTGRFLNAAAHAFPRLASLGIDMSDAYVAEARRHLRRRPRTRFAVGKAEQLPLADSSVDAITAIFLFHELPPRIRKAVAAEAARVLRPGGRFMLLDSLQMGDRPDYDGILELFPRNFHEPYYASYIREDLGRLFGAQGLRRIVDEPVFVSKLAVFEKPG